VALRARAGRRRALGREHGRAVGRDDCSGGDDRPHPRNRDREHQARAPRAHRRRRSPVARGDALLGRARAGVGRVRGGADRSGCRTPSRARTLAARRRARRAGARIAHGPRIHGCGEARSRDAGPDATPAARPASSIRRPSPCPVCAWRSTPPAKCAPRP
jgi:hypothetical protein